MKSFAQLGNDLIIRYLLGRGDGVTYVDIGCLFPIDASNTYLFYERGGHGLCIDPNPDIAETFLKVRPRDTFVNVGVGDVGGELDYVMHANPVYNTFSPEQAERVARKFARGHEKCRRLGVRKIAVKPFHEILGGTAYGASPDSVDVLSIDVEGYETKIVSSIDFNRFRPNVICLEHIVDTSRPTDVYQCDIAQILKGRGYHVASFTGHDLYFHRT